MYVCPECHHRPSGRVAEHGAECQCKCHDAADAAPDLLAACHAVRDWWEEHQNDLASDGEGEDWPVYDTNDPPAFVVAALAALAKASP